MAINPLNSSVPIVDEHGKPTLPIRLLSEAVSRLPPKVGSGSPENVVEGKQGELYMDTTGTAGSILYIKQVDAISANIKRGWILV